MNRLNSECVLVSIEGATEPLPDWAISAVEIGVWARYAAVSSDSRLILCCVVPCRAVFSALIGLGAVAAGGALFSKGFSWTDLLNLEAGTEIFWEAPEAKQKFTGVLQPQEEFNGQQTVPVRITKGPPRMRGMRWQFTESKFRECTFSEEKLPSNATSGQFERAKSFFSSLGVSSDSSWLMTAGAEVRIVSNRVAFKRGLEGWGLASGGESSPSPIDKLLILKDEEDSAFAKARLTHARGSITHDCPVSVLDGPLAFQRIPDIETGSLVVVLERNELAEEHFDLLIQAEVDRSLEHEQKFAELVPDNIPLTVEITGCYLREP